MTTQPSATALLREEHRLILRVAAALERLLDIVDAGAPDWTALERTVEFLRLFADLCHHGKEEDLLFTELEAQGMPRDTGPIAVMLHEHREGRALVGAMSGVLERARQGDEAALARLVDAGRGYVDLIRGHIRKEDDVLFGIADRIVVGPACRRLCDAYTEACRSRFEGATKARLEALGEEIVAATDAGQDTARTG